MAIEVDMAKAYDIVEWDVLMAILRAHGFSNTFSDLIFKCLSLVNYSILVNGSPYGFFQAHVVLDRGTRYHLLSLHCW